MKTEFSQENTFPQDSNLNLSDEVAAQLEVLSDEGNEYFDEEEYDKAISVWKQALALIPNPQHAFSESFWLESAIGDAYFMLEKNKEALPHFLNAKSNIKENAHENAFIMLRLGQMYFEANEFENAKEYLLLAYTLDGEEIFQGSKEKYLEFLKENMDLSEI